jgi:hypothetical protein
MGSDRTPKQRWDGLSDVGWRCQLPLPGTGECCSCGHAYAAMYSVAARNCNTRLKRNHKDLTYVPLSNDTVWYKYTLTPCNKDLLEKLLVAQLVNQFLAFRGTLGYVAVFTRTCHWSSKPPPLQPKCIYFKSTFISSSNLCLDLPREFFPLSSQNPIQIWDLFYAQYTPRPSCARWVYHPNTHEPTYPYHKAPHTIFSILLSLLSNFSILRGHASHAMKKRSRHISEYTFVLLPVLRQIHSIFQRQFSTECKLVLPCSIYSILTFP